MNNEFWKLQKIVCKPKTEDPVRYPLLLLVLDSPKYNPKD